MPLRRGAIAFGLSLAVHAAAVVGVVAIAAWRGLSLAPRIELVPITLTEVKELPLGPPPGGSEESESDSAPRPRRRVRHRIASTAGTLATGGRDAGAPTAADARRPADSQRPEPAAPRPRDLSGYGPEGSRLTALLRLDRLRATPDAASYIGPIDEVLRLLPDRRRLLEGTGLDLYRDFDALLIATPDPFDDAVTFLAVRHHLDDAALRAALDRGAAAGHHPIEWREEAGRPVGARHGEGRDDRLFVLPEPHLAVIAPPAYAKLLIEPPPGDAGRLARGERRASPDADHRGGAWGPSQGPHHNDWRGLVARIDAEDGAMPEEAVFMLTATNLIRGEASGAPAAMPRVLSLLAGTAPSPFLQLTAEFAAEAQARAWQAEWPAWRQKLLGNPLVLLAGLNPIVTRAELERSGATITLHTTATPEETRRILQMVVNFAHGGIR
jgi:hypothetical protein